MVKALRKIRCGLWLMADAVVASTIVRKGSHKSYSKKSWKKDPLIID